MQEWEYRVVAAPRRAARVRGLRTPEDRFAMAVEAELNRLAVEGWEYLRADALPQEERQGILRGSVAVTRTLLVFRRAVASPFERAGLGAFPYDAAEPPLAPSAPPFAAPPLAAPPRPAPRRAPLDDLLAVPEPPPSRQEPRFDPAPRAEPRPEPRPDPRLGRPTE